MNKWPFSGIDEKLERSRQNIFNLQSEIKRFFDKSKYPVLPQHDTQLLLEVLKYHEGRDIPPRFGVLAGETIHHLRSCLDHLMWYFSAPYYRDKYPSRIEFPILEAPPGDKKSLKRYIGKVKGISDPAAAILVEFFQPYYTPDPFDSALLILHKMDIVDKHRELVLCFSSGAIEIPLAAVQTVVRKHFPSYQGGVFNSSFEDAFIREMKNHAKITATVSFRDFGRRKLQAVVPGLIQLHNFVVEVVKRFSGLLPQQ